MPRYYKIVITNSREDDGSVWVSPSLEGLATDASYTSVVNGRDNPSALDVQLDIPVFTFDLPRQGARARVYGITIKEAAQGINLQGRVCSIFGGMDKGLPLSRQFKPDLLVKGTIWQSSGNWEGTSTYLDILLVPLFSPDAKPDNTVGTPMVFTWIKGGDPLVAIEDAIKQAYPDFKVTGKLHPDLTTNQAVHQRFNNMTAFGSWLKSYTAASQQGSQYSSLKGINGAPYSGILFMVKEKTVFVTDNSQTESPIKTADGKPASTLDTPKEIKFIDLVGQPSWKTAFKINFRTIMRGDLQCFDFIKLPPKLSVITPPSAAGISSVQFPSRDASIFQGTFQISEMHHLGRFRQATGDAWVTSIDAFTLTPEKKVPAIQQGTIGSASP